MRKCEGSERLGRGALPLPRLVSVLDHFQHDEVLSYAFNSRGDCLLRLSGEAVREDPQLFTGSECLVAMLASHESPLSAIS